MYKKANHTHTRASHSGRATPTQTMSVKFTNVQRDNNNNSSTAIKREFQRVKQECMLFSNVPCEHCQENFSDGFCANVDWICKLKAGLFPRELVEFRDGPTLNTSTFLTQHMTPEEYLAVVDHIVQNTKYTTTLGFLLANLNNQVLTTQPHLDREVLSVERLLHQTSEPHVPIEDRAPLQLTVRQTAPPHEDQIKSRLDTLSIDLVATLRRLWKVDGYLDSFNTKRCGTQGPCLACEGTPKVTVCTRFADSDNLRQEMLLKGSLDQDFIFQDMDVHFTLEPSEYWEAIQHILQHSRTVEVALWAVVFFHHHLMLNNRNIHMFKMAQRTEQAFFRMFLNSTSQ